MAKIGASPYVGVFFFEAPRARTKIPRQGITRFPSFFFFWGSKWIFGEGFQLLRKARYLFSRIYDFIFEGGGLLDASSEGCKSPPHLPPPHPNPQRNLWRAPYYVADPAGASMTIVKRQVFENATPTSLPHDQDTFKIVCVSLNTTSAIPSWLG